MSRWTISWAFRRLNGILTNLKRLWCDLNAVFLGICHLFPSATSHFRLPKSKTSSHHRVNRYTGPSLVSDWSPVQSLCSLYGSRWRTLTSHPSSLQTRLTLPIPSLQVQWLSLPLSSRFSVAPTLPISFQLCMTCSLLHGHHSALIEFYILWHWSVLDGYLTSSRIPTAYWWAPLSIP